VRDRVARKEQSAWTAAGEPAVRVRRDVAAESLRSERPRTEQVVTEAPRRSPLRFVVLATYVLLRLTGVSVPDPEVPLPTALVATAGFWAAALADELGWSGYAIDPLQGRLGALRAGILLGIVWAVWHVIPLLQIGRTVGWIAWWSLGTVAFRVLLTWVYDNTGKSVAAPHCVMG
jgi:membrane protease YdiL (CAAX protease family)